MRDFAKAAKRAAKQNPAWKPAKLYRFAHDNGVTVFDGNGELQFDLIEETYGFLDLTKEDSFTLSETYDGDARLTVLSNAAPNDVALIHLDGSLYIVQSLVSAGALRATVRYACNATDEAPTIRTV